MSRATLIQRQDAALAAMHEPRSSERRKARHNARVLGHYRKHAAKLGYSQEQIDAQVRDLRDMYQLELNAEVTP